MHRICYAVEHVLGQATARSAWASCRCCS